MPSIKVFIVDDDPSVLRLLESALFNNGYQTYKANSGEEALSMLED